MPSSVLSTISYRRATASLTITFVSGTVYIYRNVPEEKYVGLLASKSKGKYFNRYIKEIYPFEKVAEDGE
ncbi:MAG: KTSC domain-containing protein [Ginsengibacter sp.]